MLKFGTVIKLVTGISLNIIGNQISKIATEIGDIVKSNQAVRQLTDPYGSILVREVANRFPLIAIGFYIIGSLLLVWFGMDLRHLLIKDKIK